MVQSRGLFFPYGNYDLEKEHIRTPTCGYAGLRNVWISIRWDV